MNSKAMQTARTARVGAVIMLAACFCMSAILRAGEVVAELPSAGDDGFGNPIPQRPVSTAVTAEAPIVREVGPEAVLAELRRQRKDLERREAEVAARERELIGLGDHMQRRLEEVRAARERLARTAALVHDAAGKDVQRLAQMYQQMKPKQAGQIFNEMDPSFAAGFIAEMRPDSAALVMANMDAEKAYAVSLLLAGRNIRQAQAAAQSPAEQNSP